MASTPTPPLPSPTAGTKEVQDYIAQILITRHNATPELAREKAALWAVGHGGDFRIAAEANRLDGIFGTNLGICLAQSVLDDADEEWKASWMGVFTCGFLKAAVLLLVTVLFFAYIRGDFLTNPSVPLANGLHLAAQINYAARRPKTSPLYALCILVLFATNVFYDTFFLIARYA